MSVGEPYDMPGAEVTCWNCGGEGVTFDCFDGFCLDCDVGCDDCTEDCEICHGKGGWTVPDPAGPGPDAGGEAVHSSPATDEQP